MKNSKMSLLLRLTGVGLAIAGLLCLTLKLCKRFDRLCKHIVDDEDDALGYDAI